MFLRLRCADKHQQGEAATESMRLTCCWNQGTFKNGSDMYTFDQLPANTQGLCD
jgi:hypothetical protein